MPAKARELLVAISRRDVTHAMPEQAAQVANFFLEGRRRTIWIVLGCEQQRMPAPRAYVLVAPIAFGELLVVMLAEKARQRMPDARDRAVLSEVITAAPAPPVAIRRRLEDVVVDVMSPHRARDFSQ